MYGICMKCTWNKTHKALKTKKGKNVEKKMKWFGPFVTMALNISIVSLYVEEVFLMHVLFVASDKVMCT